MKEENDDKEAALSKIQELYKHVTDDDMDSIHIYEKLFFGEHLSPCNSTGTDKLLLADAKVKASITYHDNKTSIKKNMKQISNANTTSGQSAFLSLLYKP